MWHETCPASARLAQSFQRNARPPGFSFQEKEIGSVPTTARLPRSHSQVPSFHNLVMEAFLGRDFFRCHIPFGFVSISASQKCWPESSVPKLIMGEYSTFTELFYFKSHFLKLHKMSV